MRVLIAVLIASAALQATPAVAYENFIPQGHSYSPDTPELPEFNSEEDRITSQADIYESEIYNRQRRAKIFSSQFEQFRSSQEMKGGSEFIDY
jgi:hypothetical protein